MPSTYGLEMLRLARAGWAGSARAGGIAAAVAITLCVMGCTGNETWRRAAPISGYGNCGDHPDEVLRVWYEAGLGVSKAEASVVENIDVVRISILIEGAGDYPAIAEERWIDVELSNPVAGRAVVDEKGNNVPARACSTRP